MLQVLATIAVLAAAPAGRVRVAVLYFDNNSSQREYDVLQKGLADMMVTDLSSVPALQIVEREKLQKLVDELKLQKTAYFDPATAQKMGKGLGAQFVVTGALATISPQMRIDIRLIEVTTGKVVFADKVVGAAEQFFDLQQELVDRFVAGLNVKLLASQRAKSGAIDVAGLLTYSQGLDSADKGDFATASKKLAAVVQASPRFSLGKTKYDEILKRLAESSDRRTNVMGVAETELVRSLTARIASAEPDVQLAYRVAQGNYLIFKLEQLVGVTRYPLQMSVTSMDKRPEAFALMQRYVDNGISGLALKAHGARRANLEQADDERARAIGIPELKCGDLSAPGLAKFILFGSEPSFCRRGDKDLTIRPTLAQVDPKLAEQAFGLIDQEISVLVREKNSLREIGTAMELRGEGLILLGRKEEAIASWQSYLDRYPTGDRYKEFEKKIQDLLGISKEAKEWDQKLEVCSNDLSSVVMEASARAVRSDGVPGLRRLIDRIKTSCKKSIFGPSYINGVDHFGSIEAISRNDCTFFKEAMRRAMADKSPNPIDAMKKLGAEACP